MSRSRLWVVVAMVMALMGALVVRGPGQASADTAPPDTSRPTTIAADVLPTPQINGVVWTQLVVGNTVFVGGDFTTARPFGAAAGVNEVPRTHLLSYNIETGELTNFAPVLNGQVLALAVSRDGKTLYVGGSFSTIGGVARSRLAAFDVATLALKSNWKTVASTTVRAITVSNTTVYFAGEFSKAADAPGKTLVTRPFLAASDATTGVLTNWNPSANRYIRGMALTNDQSKVVVGGHFDSIGGSTAGKGIAALSPTTGQALPWEATNYLHNASTAAAIQSVTTDANGVLVTGFTFSGGGDLESVARLDDKTGAIKWISDCRGDTHSAFAQANVVYTVSHNHRCPNVPNGFEERYPRQSPGSAAYTDYKTGVLLPEIYGNWINRAGQPAPTMLDFFPNWYFGTYTPSDQGAWNVTGNDKYVVFGGEFIGLNGKLQQGLTRMARPEYAPNLNGPVTMPEMTPSVVSYKAGEAFVGWKQTYDHDNLRLTYRVYRNFVSVKDVPVYTVTADSTWHNRGGLSFIDKGLTPGTTYDYTVIASDPYGNRKASGKTAVTISGGATTQPYGQVVVQDGPEHYFRFAGSAASLRNLGSVETATSGSGVSLTTGSPLQDTGDTVGSFNGGSTSFSAPRTQGEAPNVFSVEAWVKTSDSNGGRVAGFSTRYSGTSNWTDRQIYLDSSGRIAFGVDKDGSSKVAIMTPAGQKYNDNAWHHVVGTMSGDGITLYVDGQKIGSDSSVVAGHRMAGSWRIGTDTLSGWPSAIADGRLTGQIDEVAVYPSALSAARVKAHFDAAGGVVTLPSNVLPVAAFTTSQDGRTVSFDASGSKDPDGSIVSYAWNFGDPGDTAAGTGVAPSHTYGKDGSYPVTLTVTDDRGGKNSTSATVTLSPVQQLGADSFARTTALGGWGTADTGGAWSACKRCSTGSGVGQMNVRPGDNPITLLSGVSSTSSDVTAEVTLDKLAAGTDAFVAVIARGSGADGYRGRLTLTPAGTATATLQRVVGGVSKNLAKVPLSGTFSAGETIVVRVQAVGTSPTQLRFKVWKASAAEPQAWTVSVTDNDPAWQQAGSPGVFAYAASALTNGPLVVSWDNVKVTKAD